MTHRGALIVLGAAVTMFPLQSCSKKGKLNDFLRIPREEIVWVVADSMSDTKPAVMQLIVDKLTRDGFKVLNTRQLNAIDANGLNLAYIGRLDSASQPAEIMEAANISMTNDAITISGKCFAGQDLALAVVITDPRGKPTLFLSAQQTDRLLSLHLDGRYDFEVHDHIGPYAVGWFKGRSTEIMRSLTVTRPSWLTIESKHFVVQYTDAVSNEDAIRISDIDEASFLRISQFLDTTVDQKITHYIYPTNRMKRVVTGDGGNAHAAVKYREIHSVYSRRVHAIGAHEIAHIVASQVNVPPPLFGEGFAVCMESTKGEQTLSPNIVDMIERNGLALESLLVTPIFLSLNSEVAYPAAGSFVAFLLKKYGRERFLQIYRSCSQFDSLPQVVDWFTKIYGKSLSDLQKEWRNTISSGS